MSQQAARGNESSVSQRVSLAGNAWSMMQLSKAKDAAWKVLRWVHGKDGVKRWIDSVAWPPLIWAADLPEWQAKWKGTRIAEVSKVWALGGHDIMPLPEGNEAWTVMRTPMNRALAGKTGTREALQESTRQFNERFSQRPAAWK